jgi:hypothetical protein
MKHRETLVYVIITIVGNLLPIIIGIIYYAANPEKWEGMGIFYTEGQFYLYCAAFLTTAAYIFYTFKVLNSDSNSVLLIISSFLILVVSLLYVLNIVGNNNNPNFLAYTSLFLFLISLGLYYYANYQNTVKVDVVAAQRAQINSILNQLPQ